MILNIYIGFSLLTFILYLFAITAISINVKVNYNYSSKEKISAFEFIFILIRLFITSFIPVFNISLFYVAIFKYEELENKVIKVLQEKGKIIQ